MLEHASEMFLSQLEEDSVKLIFQHDQTVILSCISCLGSVVNNVTRNFSLIRDCFLRYFGEFCRCSRDVRVDTFETCNIACNRELMVF